jgi:hypothetical protein
LPGPILQIDEKNHVVGDDDNVELPRSPESGREFEVCKGVPVLREGLEAANPFDLA